MKMRGLIFGMAALACLAGGPAAAQTMPAPGVIVQAPADQREAQQADDRREAEQADADRRAAEEVDARREDTARRERAEAAELQRTLDELTTEVDRVGELDRQRNRSERIEAEQLSDMYERIRDAENRATEEEWRRTENERMNHCVNAIDAEKQAMIDQIRQQYDTLIRQMRANGTDGDIVAQFQTTRDQAINGIVDGECEPLHERLRKQRNEEGVQRVRDGTNTPPPFRIQPAGTPRGN